MKIFFLSTYLFSLTSIGAAEETFMMGALGDSISTGFNTIDNDREPIRYGDRRDASWTTGDGGQVKSHFHRIQDQFKEKYRVIAVNRAFALAESKNLFLQVRALAAKTKTKLEYATVAIGANDLCTKRDSAEDYNKMVDDFEGYVRAATGALIERYGDIKITLASIPDVHYIWEKTNMKIPEEYKWARECRQLWKRIKMNGTLVCQPLLDPDVTVEMRQAFKNRWIKMNEILANIAAYNPNQIYFAKKIAEHRFEWDEISRSDCFHPSIKGQNALAEGSWNGELFSEF